jgi:rfaE bifunctional protein nucleotidyltransferase chain/domain
MPERARDKVLSRARAVAAVARGRRKRERIVFTNGCFDLLHVGHVRSLEQARALGDRLVVAINSDASVRRLKGPTRPVVPARQRMEVLAALACVDWVIQFRESTPLSAIVALRPDVLAKGGDWALDAIVGRAEVESWGGRVVRLREIPGVRTGALVARAIGESDLASEASKPQARTKTGTRPGQNVGKRGRSGAGDRR